MGEPVIITDIYRVAPGYEAEFAGWATAMLRELTRSSSFLDGQVLEPDRDLDWRLVHRWADGDVARHWQRSGTRARWLAAAESFARESGTDPVPVAVPARRTAPEEPPSAAPPPPPPKWKTAVVTLIAVFPPVLFFNVTLIPSLRQVNVVARTLVLCIGVTAVVTWVMMPRLMPLFRGWLNAPARHGRGWQGRPLRATTTGADRGITRPHPRGRLAIDAAPVTGSLLVSADPRVPEAVSYYDQRPPGGGRAQYLHQTQPDRRDPR